MRHLSRSSAIYSFLELIDQASFNTELTRPGDLFLTFGYFSLVTITNLGYGDIAPLTELARAIANLEAIIGQLYLVVALAWLVGMYVKLWFDPLVPPP